MDSGATRLGDCSGRYGHFKVCSPTLCLPVNELCPCPIKSNYQCSDGKCIPARLQCDGVKHCLLGEDELQCPTSEAFTSTVSQEGLSVSVVVTIATLCVFFCVLVFVGLCMFLARRQKTNTSRESQSATEPLRKCYITSDVEATTVDSAETYKPRTITFYRKCDSTDHIGFGLQPDHLVGKSCAKDDYQLSNKDYPVTDGLRYNKDLLTKTDKPDVDMYDLDLGEGQTSAKTETLGRYIFRPRLKYTNCNQILDVDKTEREKHFVINSYKHCSGKSILPTTLTFDKDPEQFSSKFASEFLCSSTPRQNARHLTLNETLSKSIESIDF